MRFLRYLAGALAALAIASCTFLGSREVVQCKADADCAGQATRRTCSGGLCVAGPSVDSGADTSVEADATGPACSSTAECDQAETPSLCGVKGCAPLLTERCPILLPTNQRVTARSVVFGVYVPDPVNGLMRKAVEQALDEIRFAVPEPPILAVLCKKDGSKAEDVLNHLADVKVPLVVGQFESNELASLVPLARERQIAVWSTLGNTSQLQEPGLTGSLFRFFLDQLENLSFQEGLDLAAARVAAIREEPGAVDVKVAMVSNSVVPESSKLAAAIRSSGLTVGGQPLALVHDVSLPSNANFDDVAFQLRDDPTKRPEVVIGIGSDEIVGSLLVSMEAKWSGFPRPVYLLTSRAKYNVNVLTDAVKIPVEPAPSTRTRILGVDFSGDRPNHATFVGVAESKQTSVLVGSFDHLYDATYVVAFAALGADAKRAQPDTPLTAAELGAGLALIDHTASDLVGIGTAEMTKGRDLVRVGTKIRFVGTTGPWQFDARHVTRRMGTSFFCFKQGGSALEYYLDAPGAALDAGNCAVPP